MSTNIGWMRNQHSLHARMAEDHHWPQICMDSFQHQSSARNLRIMTAQGDLWGNRQSLGLKLRGSRFWRLFDPCKGKPKDAVDLSFYYKDTVQEILRICHSRMYDPALIPECCYGQLLCFATDYRCNVIQECVLEAIADQMNLWTIETDAPFDHPSHPRGNPLLRSRIIELFCMCLSFIFMVFLRTLSWFSYNWNCASYFWF